MTVTAPVSVTVSRRFDAPVAGVFDAWLDVEVARHWLFTMPDTTAGHAEIDPRVGGSFTFVDRRGEEEVTHQGTFLEIDRPRRLRLRFWVTDRPDAVDGLDVSIEPDGNGCVLVLIHTLHPDWAAYEAFTRDAWGSMLDLLAAQLGAPPVAAG